MRYRKNPQRLLFAANMVICCESQEEAEAEQERWRDTLETKGLKVSRTCVSADMMGKQALKPRDSKGR